jgi:hypothetical protein
MGHACWYTRFEQFVEAKLLNHASAVGLARSRMIARKYAVRIRHRLVSWQTIM